MGSLLSTKDIDATVDAVMLQLEHPLLEKSLTAPRNWLFRQSELCWRFKRLDMSLWIVHVYFVHASLACRSLWHVVHTWWKLSPFTFLVLLVILNWKKEKRNEYEAKRKKGLNIPGFASWPVGVDLLFHSSVWQWSLVDFLSSISVLVMHLSLFLE